jgi:hypothetical protein
VQDSLPSEIKDLQTDPKEYRNGQVPKDMNQEIAIYSFVKDRWLLPFRSPAGAPGPPGVGGLGWSTDHPITRSPDFSGISRITNVWQSWQFWQSKSVPGDPERCRR